MNDKPKTVKHRGNIIDFVDARRKVDDDFIKELSSDASLGRWDKITTTVKGDVRVNDGYNDIIYDVVDMDLTGVELRLSRTASHFINKYEKINRVVEGMGFIINRYVVLKDLWIHECRYQEAKLSLLM